MLCDSHETVPNGPMMNLLITCFILTFIDTPLAYRCTLHTAWIMSRLVVNFIHWDSATARRTFTERWSLDWHGALCSKACGRLEEMGTLRERANYWLLVQYSPLAWRSPFRAEWVVQKPFRSLDMLQSLICVPNRVHLGKNTFAIAGHGAEHDSIGTAMLSEHASSDM